MTESPPTSINLERAAHKKLHTLVEVKIGKKSYAPLLDEYSLMELLEDVGQIRFYSSSTGKVWLGEILGRHRLVFERLGLENCLLNPAMYK